MDRTWQDIYTPLKTTKLQISDMRVHGVKYDLNISNYTYYVYLWLISF